MSGSDYNDVLLVKVLWHQIFTKHIQHIFILRNYVKRDIIKNNFRISFRTTNYFLAVFFSNISGHLIFLDLFVPLQVSKKF